MTQHAYRVRDAHPVSVRAATSPLHGPRMLQGIILSHVVGTDDCTLSHMVGTDDRILAHGRHKRLHPLAHGRHGRPHPRKWSAWTTASSLMVSTGDMRERTSILYRGAMQALAAVEPPCRRLPPPPLPDMPCSACACGCVVHRRAGTYRAERGDGA
eukprot:165358-Chlamydomonas_euryale.AAC.6